MKIVNTYNKLKCLYVMKSPFFHSSATERVKYVVVVDLELGKNTDREWSNKISAMNDLNFDLPNFSKRGPF